MKFDESKKEILDRIGQIEQRLDGSKSSRNIDVYFIFVTRLLKTFYLHVTISYCISIKLLFILFLF